MPIPPAPDRLAQFFQADDPAGTRRVIRETGVGGIRILSANLQHGEVRIPASDRYSLQLGNAACGYFRVDTGHRYCYVGRRGGFNISPPRVDWNFETTGNPSFIGLHLPQAWVSAVIEEIAPGTRDFGVLHTRYNGDVTVAALVRRIWAESAIPPGALFIDAAVRALIALLLRVAGEARALPATGALSPRALRLALERMADELIDEPTLAELAALTGHSVKHFARAFKQSTGVAPHHWLLRHRIARAQALLHDNVLSLAEIALVCGYADQSHFGAAFKRATGTSPGAFRRERAR